MRGCRPRRSTTSTPTPPPRPSATRWRSRRSAACSRNRRWRPRGRAGAEPSAHPAPACPWRHAMVPESAVATRIRTALAEHLKRDVSKVRLQDDLRKDLGLDSLAMIELLFRIEEVFDLEIPNDDLSQITTVGDVVVYVEQRMGTATAAAVPVSAPAAAGKVTARRPAPEVAPKRPA